MIKLLSLIAVVSIYSCGSESNGGDSNPGKGPENPIDNTASESEFQTGSSEVVKTFDDYTAMKKKFVPTTSLGFVDVTTFENSYSSRMDEESNSDSSESEELIDAKEIKADFEKLTSCDGSFKITDEMVQNLKEQIEEVVKELKEGKLSEDSSDAESSVENSDEDGGELTLVKVETDDAIAYDIAAQGTPAEGISIDGRISGRSNKEEGVFQFYKKINQSFDYNKIFGSLFPNMDEGADDSDDSLKFEFPSGIISIELESTIEGNTKDKTIVSMQKIKQDSSETKKAEDSFSMYIELKESVKGGDLPEYSQSVSQSMTNTDGTTTVVYEFKMALDKSDKLKIEMKVDSSENDQDFEFSYELDADSDACKLVKE